MPAPVSRGSLPPIATLRIPSARTTPSASGPPSVADDPPSASGPPSVADDTPEPPLIPEVDDPGFAKELEFLRTGDRHPVWNSVLEAYFRLETELTRKVSMDRP